MMRRIGYGALSWLLMQPLLLACAAAVENENTLLCNWALANVLLPASAAIIAASICAGVCAMKALNADW